jgi:hypothetical protein
VSRSLVLDGHRNGVDRLFAVPGCYNQFTATWLTLYWSAAAWRTLAPWSQWRRLS